MKVKKTTLGSATNSTTEEQVVNHKPIENYIYIYIYISVCSPINHVHITSSSTYTSLGRRASTTATGWAESRHVFVIHFELAAFPIHPGWRLYHPATPETTATAATAPAATAIRDPLRRVVAAHARKRSRCIEFEGGLEDGDFYERLEASQLGATPGCCYGP